MTNNKNEKKDLIDFSYFPGCSLATSAKENNQSLKEVCLKLGVNLVELEDWNCCGSSSAHALNHDLGVELASRNLSLAPEGRPLLIACPSCNLRLTETKVYLDEHEDARKTYEEKWGVKHNKDLEIVHFFDLFNKVDLAEHALNGKETLNGLKFVPYYGCMLSGPAYLKENLGYHGLMEKALESLGAEPLSWGYSYKCCGTFLSVAKPEAVIPMVNDIMENALERGAECLVTACAMCQLNVEIRCSNKAKIPIFHFSELISLALGSDRHKKWFARHLVDPVPVLEKHDLMNLKENL